MSGPQCCENPPDLSSGSGGGAGHVQLLGGFKCYLSGPSHSTLAVLLVSDVYGYEAPNLRKLADKVAAAGFYVVVPDFLRGDPHVPNDERPLGVWLKDHGPDQGFEDAKSVIAALKSNGVTKIGAGGFCWGAKVVVELAKYAYIDAAVLLHPSFVTLDDMHAIKVPVSILGAEIDHMSPRELIKQFEMALNAKPELKKLLKIIYRKGWSIWLLNFIDINGDFATKPELANQLDATIRVGVLFWKQPLYRKVDAFVKIFPGVVHGWSVRYKDEDEVAVKSAEEAHQDMLGWFQKHLN